jgi:hypothetical protein
MHHEQMPKVRRSHQEDTSVNSFIIKKSHSNNWNEIFLYNFYEYPIKVHFITLTELLTELELYCAIHSYKALRYGNFCLPSGLGELQKLHEFIHFNIFGCKCKCFHGKFLMGNKFIIYFCSQKYQKLSRGKNSSGGSK